MHSAFLRLEPLLEEQEAQRWVTPEEWAYASTLKAPHRRREWLSWRAIVQRELGPMAVTYHPTGAPQLPAGMGFLGISHNRTHVAVSYSPTAPTAVDIERSDRNFQRILTRYLRPEEQRLSDHEAWLAIAWSAKECLYKLALRRELDLLQELHLEQITRFDESGGELIGSVCTTRYRLRFAPIPNGWMVWHLTE